MPIFETERMIIKTNLDISNGSLVFPDNNREIDIISPQNRAAEDGGFVCYDKNDQTKQICHIGLQSKTFPLELSYGIEKNAKEIYEGKRYMQEALKKCIDWLFTSANVDQLYACIRKEMQPSNLEGKNDKNDNEASKHILQKNNFRFLKIVETRCEIWYILTRSNYLELA